jgi:hypothetical protein
MLGGAFRQLNAEHGFSLQVPHEPEFERFRRDLDLVEHSHLQYLGVRNVLRMAQPAFADRVVRALTARLRAIYEAALGEVESWNKSAAAQLDGQLRERRKNFARRIEALDRIRQAAAGLEERIAEIDALVAGVERARTQLWQMTDPLIEASQAAEPASPSPLVAAA